MSGVTTSSLSLAWSLRNWVILDYEEANGLTIRPWAPFLLSLPLGAQVHAQQGWVLCHVTFNEEFLTVGSLTDNALEVSGLLTPLHIVPEWYFLCQYAMLKAVPNKNAGFIILLTSIFTFFFFGEIRLIGAFTRLMDYNNSFSFSFLFSIFLSFLWIGAQFPQEKFLSYGRILTLHYYFLIMCILFFMQLLKEPMIIMA